MSRKIDRDLLLLKGSGSDDLIRNLSRADGANFVPGFIGIGLVPDSGGSFFIVRLLVFARAFEWMTSNRRLSAAEAHA